MITEYTDILIIGAGAAGMAAALAAEKKGFKDILLVERGKEPGGILLQCTHKGFGRGYFGEEMTGTEYADRFRKMLNQSSVRVWCDTMVLRLGQDKTALLSGRGRLLKVRFEICVLASGCRERTIQSLDIDGTRPAGIMTCGTAQKLMNVDGLHVGDDVIILGTGDVGQIVARDLVCSGRKVLAMIEKQAAPGGLKRNQENCLKAYSIPVILNTEIVRICGTGRIKGVYVRHRLTGKVEFLSCGTLLTAIGMIPERELAGPDWLIMTGNCDFVHDIVDSVTADAFRVFDHLS